MKLHRPDTPGYNCRLCIEFKVDRKGRRYAQYWSRAAFRSIRVSVADAELWISTGTADELGPVAHVPEWMADAFGMEAKPGHIEITPAPKCNCPMAGVVTNVDCPVHGTQL